MKRMFPVLFLLVGGLTVGAMLPRSAGALEDAIIAIVNDDVITLKDLRDYVHSLSVQLRMEGRSVKEISDIMADLEKNGLTKLVEDKLILTEANRIGMEVRDEIVDQRLAEIKSAYPSEQAFLDAIITQGATISDLRRKLLEHFKITFMIDREVKSKVVVNPQEVTDYYKGHFEDFQQPERMDLESIYLPDGPDQQQQIQQITTAVANGEVFAALAKKYSRGPNIGVIARGELMPVIEQTVFELKPRQVSGPIEVEGGVYIVKVKAILPPHIASLEETKEEISKTLFREKFKRQYQEWITKLRNEAFIDIKE